LIFKKKLTLSFSFFLTLEIKEPSISVFATIWNRRTLGYDCFFKNPKRRDGFAEITH
jgi:hypothetical protein